MIKDYLNIEDLKKEVVNAINNQTVIFIKSLFNKTPSWNQFIQLIDYAESKDYVSSNIRNDAMGFGGNMYLRIADVFNPITGKNAENIMPELDFVVDFFNNIFDHKSIYSEAYLNFKSNISKTEPHNDDWIAVAWGCEGVTEWQIYNDYFSDKNKEKYDSYMMNPGDIIIIPKGVVHCVVPQEPRASISLAY